MKTLLGAWNKEILVSMMAISCFSLNAMYQQYISIDKEYVQFSPELSTSKNRLLYDPITANFILEQSGIGTFSKGWSLIERGDIDAQLRGIPGDQLAFLLGSAWFFDYNGKKLTAFDLEDFLLNLQVSKKVVVIYEEAMVNAALDAQPGGSYLQVVKIGSHYGIHLRTRVRGGGGNQSCMTPTALGLAMAADYAESRKTEEEKKQEPDSLTLATAYMATSGDWERAKVVAKSDDSLTWFTGMQVAEEERKAKEKYNPYESGSY